MFKKFREETIQNLDQYGVMKVLEMVLNLNDQEIKSKCEAKLEIIDYNSFKKDKTFLKTDEKVFILIMKKHATLRKKLQEGQGKQLGKSQLLSSFDVMNTTLLYCEDHFSDPEVKEKKMFEFQDLFLPNQFDGKDDDSIVWLKKEVKHLARQTQRLTLAVVILMGILTITVLAFTNLSGKYIFGFESACTDDIIITEIEADSHARKLNQRMSEVGDAISNEVKNQAITWKNEIITAKDELMQKMSLIQQQQLVQSSELNNMIQSLSQLKTNVTGDSIVINLSPNLITPSHFEKLKEWIPKPANQSNAQTCPLDLLYKGSKNGFSAQTFHEKCDYKSPTISFVKSQTHGRIFGGYTEQTWDEVPGGYKKDEKAFLFSLTHNEKYPVAQPQFAIYCRHDRLMDFGTGPSDIMISGGSNSNTNSHSDFPNCYQCSKFNDRTEESKAYLAGSYNFKVEEIEVYQIVWD